MRRKDRRKGQKAGISRRNRLHDAVVAEGEAGSFDPKLLISAAQLAKASQFTKVIDIRNAVGSAKIDGFDAVESMRFALRDAA